jgi:hypothetical protein
VAGATIWAGETEAARNQTFNVTDVDTVRLATLPIQPSNRGDSPMNAIKMYEEINHNRRRFLGNAAMTFAAAQVGIFSSADAQSRKAQPANVPAIHSRSCR